VPKAVSGKIYSLTSKQHAFLVLVVYANRDLPKLGFLY